MAHSTGLRRAWVHLADDAIDGIAIARVRCGGFVWDVRHLWVDGEPGGVAQELLVRVCEEAAGHGARRVFLETGQTSDERELSLAAPASNSTPSRCSTCAAAHRPKQIRGPVPDRGGGV